MLMAKVLFIQRGGWGSGLVPSPNVERRNQNFRKPTPSKQKAEEEGQIKTVPDLQNILVQPTIEKRKKIKKKLHQSAMHGHSKRIANRSTFFATTADGSRGFDEIGAPTENRK